MKIVEKWLNENVECTKMERCKDVLWIITIEKDMPTVRPNGEATTIDRVVKISFGSTYKNYTISYEYELGRIKSIFKTTKQKELVQKLESFLNELNYIKQ